MSVSDKLNKLNRFNLILAGLHALQGVAIIALSRDFKLPISTAYLKFNETSKQLEPASQHLFDLSLPMLVAMFFFLSAVFHFLVATKYRLTYETDLKKGINKFRWIEYSLSASIMMVAISLLVGVYDLGNLIAIFVLVGLMNLCGLIMEIHNQTTKQTNWLSFWIGCLAGAVPWLIVGLYFWASANNGSAPPNFVYFIYVSIFLFFNCFAINMALQYKRVGKWKEYLYGERVYIILSLVAKSALAWQIFAGTLRP